MWAEGLQKGSRGFNEVNQFERLHSRSPAHAFIATPTGACRTTAPPGPHKRNRDALSPVPPSASMTLRPPTISSDAHAKAHEMHRQRRSRAGRPCTASGSSSGHPGASRCGPPVTDSDRL